jgi:2,4-dienoyl-CoA reductase (NADPH2)
VQFLERTAAAPVRVVPLTRLEAIADGGVHVRAVLGGERTHLPADAVIVVGERRPRSFAWLGEPAAGVRAVGDCLVPRRVQHAVAEGRAAAAEILQAAPERTLVI